MARSLASWGGDPRVMLSAEDALRFQEHWAQLLPEMQTPFLKMVEFLGPPRVRPHLEVTGSQDKHSLWKYWQGHNPAMSEVVNRDLVATGGWILQMLPREDFKGESGTISTIVYESAPLDIVPEEGVNELMFSYMEEQHFSLAPRGISFCLDQDFIFAPNGQAIFAGHIEQMERSVQETMSISILRVLRDFGMLQMSTTLNTQWSRADFRVKLQWLTGNFGIFQKREDGHGKLQAEAVRYAEIAGVTLTDEILPPGALNYIVHADPVKTSYKEGGNNIYDKEIRADQLAITTRVFPHILIHQSRAFRLPGAKSRNAITDWFTEDRVIGEYYYMPDWTWQANGKWEDYHSADRTLRIGHMERVMQDLPLLDMLENSLLWPEGASNEHRLWDVGQQILYFALSAERRKNNLHREDQQWEVEHQGWSEIDSHRPHDDDDDDDVMGLGGLSGSSSSSRRHKKRKPGVSRDRDPFTLWDLYASCQWKDQLLARLNRDGNRKISWQILSKGEATEGLPERLRLRDREKEEIKEQDLKDCLLTPGLLRSLVKCDYRLPLTFILARKSISIRTGHYMALQRGAKTGVLYTNNCLINLSRHTKRRKIGVDLNFKIGPHIRKDGMKGLVMIPDAMILGYNGGYETRFFNSSDQSAAAAESGHLKDIHVFAVNLSWQPEYSYLDVTGQVSSDMLQSSQHSQELMYPTATVYSHFWNFGRPTNIFAPENFMDQLADTNTFLFQGAQEFRHSQTGEKRRTPGQGHFGNIFNQAVADCIRGATKHFTNRSIEQPS